MSSFSDETRVELHVCNKEPILLVSLEGEIDDVLLPKRVINTLENLYFGIDDRDSDEVQDQLTALRVCAAILTQIDAAMSLEPKDESIIDMGLR